MVYLPVFVVVRDCECAPLHTRFEPSNIKRSGGVPRGGPGGCSRRRPALLASTMEVEVEAKELRDVVEKPGLVADLCGVLHVELPLVGVPRGESASVVSV